MVRARGATYNIIQVLKLSPAPCFGIILVIVVGTFALLIPFATLVRALSFWDAFFIATSATCVTGFITFKCATGYCLFSESLFYF